MKIRKRIQHTDDYYSVEVLYNNKVYTIDILESQLEDTSEEEFINNKLLE